MAMNLGEGSGGKKRGVAPEMNAVSATTPASVKSFATSPMRRMFSVRSSGEKPRFLLRP